MAVLLVCGCAQHPQCEFTTQLRLLLWQRTHTLHIREPSQSEKRSFIVNLPCQSSDSIPYSFFSILIQSFGYTTTQSLLYNAPSGAVVFIFVVSCLYLGDRFHHRIAFAMFAIAVSAVGVLLIWFLPVSNKTGRLIGYYL